MPNSRDLDQQAPSIVLERSHFPNLDVGALFNGDEEARTDFECFTIMNQTAAGLELTDTQGQWCRVVNTLWTRYSLILFFALDGDYTVAPLPQFVSEECPAAYAPVTQDEHIAAELAHASAQP